MSAAPIPDEHVPDAVEPIIAYRVWQREDDGRLRSLNGTACWVPWGWSVATCRWRHAVPNESCSCGFYATRDFETAKDIAGYFGDVLVVGKVELAGKVIEHEKGFRAERARLSEVFPVEGHRGVAEAVAARFSVPLGELIRIPEYDTAGRSSAAPARAPQRGSGRGLVWIAAVILSNVLARASESAAISDGWLAAILVLAVLGIVAGFVIQRAAARRFVQQMRAFGTTPLARPGR